MIERHTIPRTSRSRPIGRTLMALLAVALLFQGCASAQRATQKPVEMNDAQERVLGARMSAAFEDSQGVFVDKAVNDYVNNLGQKIARLSDRPTIPYTFRVLRGDTPRGLVLPGGYLYLSVGLLRQVRSQCELAGVLAHMMAHATLGHPAMALERVKDVGPNGIREILEATDRLAGVARARTALQGLKGYPREWESDADKLTLLYLSRIGITSEGYPKSIEAFLPPAAKTPVAYWEMSADDTPLEKRLAAVKGDYAGMGLDAGLPCEQQRYEPIRARLGAQP